MNSLLRIETRRNHRREGGHRISVKHSKSKASSCISGGVGLVPGKAIAAGVSGLPPRSKELQATPDHIVIAGAASPEVHAVTPCNGALAMWQAVVLYRSH